MKHLWLVQFAHRLGYKSIENSGLCHGFSMMWIQAVCTGDLNSFNERLNIFNDFANKTDILLSLINRLRHSAKKINTNDLNSLQKALLEIPAFFENLAACQTPEIIGEVFAENNLEQHEEIQITNRIQSDALEKKGGLLNPFKLKDEYSETELFTYLQRINQTLKNHQNTAILLSANVHSVAVRVLGDNQFELIDTNHLNDYGKVLSTKALTRRLYHSTFRKKRWIRPQSPLLMSTKIFTSTSQQLKLDELQPKSGISAQTRDIRGNTLVHLAAFQNDVETLKRINLDQATTNTTNIHGLAAFAIACANGYKETIDYLLNIAKTNSFVLDVNKGGAFAAAIRKQHYDIAAIIIVHPNFDTDYKDQYSGGTAVHTIAAFCKENKALPIAKEIIKRSAKTLINQKDRLGDTPLSLACALDNQQMVELLLDNGADATCKNVYGLTPLHVAVFSKRREVLEALLKSGVDVNQTNATGETALHYACKQSEREIALKKSSDTSVNYRDLIATLLPKTKLTIKDILKSSFLFKQIKYCDEKTQILFLEKALQGYLNYQARTKSLLNFKLVKRQRNAAEAFLNVLSGEADDLRKHYPALTNEPLKPLYNLYNNLLKKHKVPSYVALCTKLEVAKKTPSQSANPGPGPSCSQTVPQSQKYPTIEVANTCINTLCSPNKMI